ncbi:MAG: aldo/keto reductase [Pseudomonadota bacterium]
MEYVRFGNTGLIVSRLCLGCMTYGDTGGGGHAWALNEEDSRPFYRQALEAGINFFDTANAYSGGTSESFLGRAMRDLARRDEVVIATKAFAPWRRAPNAGGLSRKALFQAIDDSLTRLGMDYVDLYQIHRWDYNTPIEETLDALNDIVRSGKARYIGASSMFAWQFMKALHVSRSHGFVEFVSMQNHYNLIYREEEREMIPLCVDQGIALMPWSPLARGRLTRDWDETTGRSESDEYGKTLYNQQGDKEIVDTVGAIAHERGVPRAQVALAWMLSKPAMTSPIIGASKPHHLEDAVAAVTLELSAEEVERLEAPYTPRALQGMAGPMPIGGRVTVNG